VLNSGVYRTEHGIMIYHTSIISAPHSDEFRLRMASVVSEDGGYRCVIGLLGSGSCTLLVRQFDIPETVVIIGLPCFPVPVGSRSLPPIWSKVSFQCIDYDIRTWWFLEAFFLTSSSHFCPARPLSPIPLFYLQTRELQSFPNDG